MENGIMIENKTRGIYVDGKLRRDLDDMGKFIEIFSEYFFFDYWMDKEIDASQGELSQGSMFSFLANCAPMPGCGCNRFTYFDDPKFGAGYLKYIVLGLVACNLFLDDDEFKQFCIGNDEEFVIPDIDEMIQMCIKTSKDSHGIVDKMQHIIRLCNLIFIEQDVGKQKEHLAYAAKKFNEYFSNAQQEVSGWDYEFKIYDGADGVRDDLLAYLSHSDMLQDVKKVFARPYWNVEDVDIVQEAIDCIL